MEDIPLEYIRLEKETVTIVLIIGIKIVDVKITITIDWKHKNVYSVNILVLNVLLKINVTMKLPSV